MYAKMTSVNLQEIMAFQYKCFDLIGISPVGHSVRRTAILFILMSMPLITILLSAVWVFYTDVLLTKQEERDGLFMDFVQFLGFVSIPVSSWCFCAQSFLQPRHLIRLLNTVDFLACNLRSNERRKVRYASILLTCFLLIGTVLYFTADRLGDFRSNNKWDSTKLVLIWGFANVNGWHKLAINIARYLPAIFMQQVLVVFFLFGRLVSTNLDKIKRDFSCIFTLSAHPYKEDVKHSAYTLLKAINLYGHLCDYVKEFNKRFGTLLFILHIANVVLACNPIIHFTLTTFTNADLVSIFDDCLTLLYALIFHFVYWTPLVKANELVSDRLLAVFRAFVQNA